MSTISFGVKLGTIKGLSRLSNYKELKDIDVEAIRTLQRTGELPTQIKGFNGVGVLYKEGKIFSIYFLKNGNSDGNIYTYSQDGKLVMKSAYKNGIQDGISESYYEDGQIETSKVYGDGNIVSISKYSPDGSIEFTYSQITKDKGVIITRIKKENKEFTEKAEAFYTVINEEDLIQIELIIKEGAYQIFDSKGKLVEDGIYKEDKIVTSNKVDKISGFIFQDGAYKVNAEDRDYFFKVLKDFEMKGLTEEFYRENVELFGSKPYCSSIGMLFLQYHIFKGEPAADVIGSYLLKISKDVKKTAKKYTELKDNDFLVKYYKTNCKVPSENKLKFIEGLEIPKELESRKNPKEVREFFKNPVIK